MVQNMSTSLRRLSPDQRGDPPAIQPPRRTRACTSCSRKKIKCDKVFPVCSLCHRTGNSCEFPNKRKPRRRRTDLPTEPLPTHKRSNANGVNEDVELDSDRTEHTPELLLGQASSYPSEIISGETGQQLPPQAPLQEPWREYASPESFGLGTRAEHANQAPLDVQNTLGLPMGFYESNFGLPFFGMQHLGQVFDPSSSSPNNQGAWPVNDPLLPPCENLPPADNSSASSTSASRWSPHARKKVSSNEGQQEQCTILADPDGLSSLPVGLFDELINIWFDKIQGFIPLLHRPRFMDLISRIRHGNSLDHQKIDWELSLLLNAMFAMAARFSDSDYFASKPAPERGEIFARRAKAFYESSLPHLRVPTLIYLQGLTILAFYLYAMEPNPQGWVLIGICSRLAYELELDKIDETAETTEPCINDPESWSRQEDRRRLWWSIWELDGFAAAIACRRPTVDKRNMQVMLPVSDEKWFSNTSVRSAIIDPIPTKAWRTLEKCENQDVRAWFLLANFILLSAHDLAQSKHPSKEEVRALETAVACFFLIIPPEFNLPSSSLSFTNQTYQRSNWIISMNIMLQGAFIFLRFVGERSAVRSSHNSNNHFLAPLAAGSHFKICTASYHVQAEQIFTAVRLWNPAYIAIHTPFIACLVIGPAAVNLRTAIEIKKSPETHRQFTGLELELLSLVLQKVAKYWKFGSILYDIVQNICEDHAPALPSTS